MQKGDFGAEGREGAGAVRLGGWCEGAGKALALFPLGGWCEGAGKALALFPLDGCVL